MYRTMSAQFGHVEVFARKGSKWRRSLTEVVDEAARRPWATPHVESPKPAARVSGPTLDEMLARHDEILSEVRWMASDGVIYKLRKDTPTLIAAVFSHPTEIAKLDAGAAKAVQSWMRATIDWWRDQVESRGGEPMSAISHVDERFPHVHLFALHPAGHASLLHPGRVAKQQAVGDALERGQTKKQANRIGNVAYRRAMREWQDEYWESVGSLHGMTRRGQGNGSMKRADYLQKMAELAVMAKQRAALEHAAARLGVDLSALMAETPKAEAA